MPETVLGFATADWPLRLLLGAVGLVVVIGLLRMAFRRRPKAAGHGRHGNDRRLAVLDQIAIDERQRLVLVRRDDVEHLLIIGGASPVVVESRIGYPAAVDAVRAPITPGHSASVQPTSRAEPVAAARPGRIEPAPGVAGRAEPVVVPAREAPARAAPQVVERPARETVRVDAVRAETPLQEPPIVSTPSVATPAAASPAPSRGFSRLFGGLAARGAAPAAEAIERSAVSAETRVEPAAVAAPAVPRPAPAPIVAPAPEVRLEAPRIEDTGDTAALEPPPPGEPRIAVKVDPHFADMAEHIEEALRRPLTASPDVVPEADSEEAFARDLERAIGPAAARARDPEPEAAPDGTPVTEEPVLKELEAEMADLLGRAPSR